MGKIRSAVRFLAEHWVITLAILINLAIAAPVNAVRYTNDICQNGQGGWEACCTACWYFCDCDLGGGGDPPPPPPP